MAIFFLGCATIAFSERRDLFVYFLWRFTKCTESMLYGLRPGLFSFPVFVFFAHISRLNRKLMRAVTSTHLLLFMDYPIPYSRAATIDICTVLCNSVWEMCKIFTRMNFTERVAETYLN
jgi:hypothetical protein